jgi:hypothetical protein
MTLGSMTAQQYLETRINIMEDEIFSMIYDLNKVSHSPSETSFLAGSIAELSNQITKLKLDLEIAEEGEI